MSEPHTPQPSPPAITVSGVTFTSEQVVTATVRIDGREIHISKPTEPERRIGFN